MLGFGRFCWRTVDGREPPLRRRNARAARRAAHLGLGVRAIRRGADGVELATDDGETRRFDKAVVATHADQALALLADAARAERRALGAFRYTANEAVLHTDARFLPRCPWRPASWNYRVGDGALRRRSPTT